MWRGSKHNYGEQNFGEEEDDENWGPWHAIDDDSWQRITSNAGKEAEQNFTCGDEADNYYGEQGFTFGDEAEAEYGGHNFSLVDEAEECYGGHNFGEEAEKIWRTWQCELWSTTTRSLTTCMATSWTTTTRSPTTCMATI